MSLGSTLSFAQARAVCVRQPRAAKSWRPQRLAMRHIRAAEAIATGTPMKEIAGRMGVTYGALKVYVSELKQLTGLQSHVAIAEWVNQRRDALETMKALKALGVKA